MKLMAFRVTNFRSVEDSGWIEMDDVVALIGENESGKTNLLLPLWKLNPAGEGEIDPIADYPRSQYGDFRDLEPKPIFIEARFFLDDELAERIARISDADVDQVQTVVVKRSFDGQRHIEFPHVVPVRSVPIDDVVEVLSGAEQDLKKLSAMKSEEALKEAMLRAIAECCQIVEEASHSADRALLAEVKARLEEVNQDQAPKRSVLAPRYGQLLDLIDELIGHVSKLSPSEYPEVRELVLKNLPKFVYYAHYGNLDSEIYLPHVIDNMKREDLGQKEQAKARTLKVLFEFVNLKPEEILELGRDFEQGDTTPTPEEIEEIARKKKEREILLTSASSRLTREFREWWKQGDYVFRFQADGNHFRIWVKDKLRPDEIELESRSSGLQWFLSFFLTFLVESKDAHAGAILLLDEPGHSLHPSSQQILSEFFDSLAKTNQIVYTTHSPHLVDPDHLDRARVVYVDDRGKTVVSPDLRASEKDPSRTRAIQPVHAAVGLTVSDTVLYGCHPVIVEGRSDQIYLSAIKIYLIRLGLIRPQREIVFVPSGGVRGVGPLVSILTGAEDELPMVVLDSDKNGCDMKNKLTRGLYEGEGERIIQVGDICGMEGAETEDLFPTTFLARIIAREFRGPDEDFDDVVSEGVPIVPQVERYAERYELTLPPSWKVNVAKRAKDRLLKDTQPIKDDSVLARWQRLFEILQQSTAASSG